MGTKLERIAELSKENANMGFTSLYHMLNEELLLESNKELQANKASGIDGMTKKQYNENLEENIRNLVGKLKAKSYHPCAVRKVDISKGNGKVRSLGIATYEDKIVQLALKKIIEAVYEPRFLDCMYGFRPNKGCHDAIRGLNYILEKKKMNWVYDADVRGYFDNLDHEWIMKTLGVHVKDTNILRVVKRFLKAGLMERGVYHETEVGAVQGGNISPLLANIYMHYMLVLWFYKTVKPGCKGECEIVIYADDFVACFQYEEEACEFNEMLIKRLSQFGLEIAPDKTRLIEFGRFAKANRSKRGKGKPETFDFLGFTHYCSESVNSGRFRVKRKTSGKKFRLKVKAFKEWIIKNRTLPIKTLIEKANSKLTGHYRYYGITDDFKMIRRFLNEVEKLLYKWLNRRSQRNSYNFDRFHMLIERYPLAKPRIYVSVYG